MKKKSRPVTIWHFKERYNASALVYASIAANASTSIFLCGIRTSEIIGASFHIPMRENFSVRRSSAEEDSISKRSRSDRSSSIKIYFRVSNINSGARCAPPSGSGRMRSMIPLASRSGAVSFSASAACSLKFQLRQRIEEQLSGEITLYHEFSSIKIRSPKPMPSAPPGSTFADNYYDYWNFSFAISNKFRAIASACPRSSASMPDTRRVYRVMLRSVGQIFRPASSGAMLCGNLRIWHSKVPKYILLGIAAFLMTDPHRAPNLI